MDGRDHGVQGPIPMAGPRPRIIYRQVNHDQQYRQPVQGAAQVGAAP